MSIFEEKMQPGDKIIQNDGYRINRSQLERIAKKESPISKSIKEKAKELGQKYFPDEYNIYARANHEAHYVEKACLEMAQWLLGENKTPTI